MPAPTEVEAAGSPRRHRARARGTRRDAPRCWRRRATSRRRSRPRPRPPATTAAAATPTAGRSRPARPRRSRRGLVLLLVALLLAVGASAPAPGGSATPATPRPPASSGCRQTAAEQRARGRRPRRQGRATDAYSETVADGPGRRAPTPSPGARVLDGGDVTDRRSRSARSGYDVPKLNGMTEDEAQDRIAGDQHGLRQDHREVVRDRARGHRHRLRPQGRHHPAPRHRRRPGRQPRAASRSSSRQLGRQERRRRPGRRSKAAGSRSRSPQEYSDTVAEGDVISQDPHGGTLSKGDTVSLVVSLGPRAGRGPVACAARASTTPPQTLEDAGFHVDDEQLRRLRRPRLRLLAGPRRRRHGLPKGSTITLYLV